MINVGGEILLFCCASVDEVAEEMVMIAVTVVLVCESKLTARAEFKTSNEGLNFRWKAF